MEIDDNLTKKEKHEAKQPVHEWFGLSYVNYLTVPRVVLQSMPIEWQERFCSMLDEVNDCIEWGHEDADYKVFLLPYGNHDSVQIDTYINGVRTEPFEDNYSDYRHQTLPLKKIPNTTQIYYWGVWGNIEHSLWSSHLEIGMEEPSPVCSGAVILPWGKIDWNLCAKGHQHQGKALIHQKDDWTCVAFWDRSGVIEHNAHSAFFVKGEWSFSLVVEYAKEKFPKLFERFDFPIERDCNE